MKRKLFAFIILSLGVCLTTLAQERKPRISKEEFRERQEEYITRKAQLTKEEAKQFFVLFFELQDKKQKINNKVGCLIHDTKKQSDEEPEYGEVVDKIINSRLESDKLERYYILQYRKFLSDKKIFKVLTAEMNFHRELLKNIKKEEKEPANKQ